MRFKNLFVYRLGAKCKLDARDLEKSLAGHALQPCNSFEMESRGWTEPQTAGTFLHALNRHWLMVFGVDQKILPASVIRQVTSERATELEKKQAFPVGRKQMRELKQRVVDELLPRALTRRQATAAWIDPVNRWFVIDTVSQTKAERVLETLRKSGIDLPAKQLATQQSPAAAMTGWLAESEISADFSIDQDLELKSSDENKATVRYVRHNLEGKDIQSHISAGKSATRLGMTWRDKISFVLTETLQIKRINFLNVLKQDAAQNVENKEEQFDLDFTLMTGELSLFLSDLVQLLGGEKLHQA